MQHAQSKPTWQVSLRFFSFSLLATVAAFIVAGAVAGWAAILTTLLLVIIELAFSFENAIVNAKVVSLLSPRWQKVFLTVGILIAIFGMRIIFPVVIVALSAHLPFDRVVDLALHDPEEYGHKLHMAHAAISSFGGIFLLMLALHFFVDERRQVHWLRSIERPLQRLNRHWSPTVITTMLLALVGGSALVAHSSNARPLLTAGLVGMLTYLALQLLVLLAERLRPPQAKRGQLAGLAGLATFVYLEVLDASFSFDGVIGAFAITNSVLLIGLGLGAGAVWVRSLTVYMVRQKTLDNYPYLEHGAHYTVLVLALSLLAGVFVEIPDAFVGVIGAALIGGSFLASRRANKASAHTLQ